jgi:hypothetical protein
MITNIKRNWLIYIFLIVITLAVYSRVTEFGFVQFDDGVYVMSNDHVKTGLTAANIRHALTFTQDANWIPLTWVSLMLDAEATTGQDTENAAVYHRTNVIIHVLNTLLLFIVLSSLTGLRWRSAFIAALFALHPLHVESVAWVSERKDVLSTFFMMLTLWSYVWYVRKPETRRYVVVAVLFVLGLMSKSMLVTLPIVLLLLDFWPLRRVAGWTGDKKIKGLSWRQLAIEKAPLLAFSAAISVVTFLAQKHGGAVGTLDAYPLGVRLANALVSYFMYLWKMIWPVKLACLYPHPGTTLPAWEVACSGLMLVGITLAAVRSARKLPWLTVGWLWYVITLIPVIGIVQVGQQALADRYTYTTLIGIFIVVVWSVCELVPKGSARVPLLAVLATAVILPLSVRAYSQVGFWRDNITFFTHAIQVTSNNRVALHNLALAQGDLGKSLVNKGRADDAIAHLREALRIDPTDALLHKETSAEYHNYLGIAYGMKGEMGPAREQFLEALKNDKNNTDAMCNLVKMALDARNADEALRYARQAYSVAPNNKKVRLTLDTAEAWNAQNARGKP